MENPCWDGYKALGTKEKDGKEVPNCVPEKSDHSEGPLVPEGWRVSGETVGPSIPESHNRDGNQD